MPITMSNAEVFAVLNTIDQLEINAGERGKQQAASQNVEAFADRLVHEHTSTLQIRHDLADKMATQPSTPQLASALEKRHRTSQSLLREKSGYDFDEAFIKDQITIHEQLIRFVQDAEDSMFDPELRQHLRSLRPGLLSHLSAARAVERDHCQSPSMDSANERCRFIR
jgi:putative membrane protein